MFRVWLSFFAGTLGIAAAAILVRAALPAPPVVTAFYRMLFATLLLGGWLLARRGSGRPASRRGLALAAAAGACLGADLALWYLALVATSVANAALLVNTTPIHVGLFSTLVLRQRAGAGFTFGAVLALAGAALLLGVERRASGQVHGELLALAAALFYSGYLLLVKRARADLDAAPAVAVGSASAAAVIAAFALLRGDPFGGFPAHSWAAIAASGLVSQVGGVLAIAWSLRHLRATFASVALLSQPVWVAGLGWLLLGESLSPTQALGGAVVLAGVFSASRGAADASSGDALRPTA